MKRLMQFFTLAALVFISAGVPAQEPVLLKYGFKAGATFQQEMEIQQNTVQSMMGQEIKVVGEVKGLVEYQVEAVSPDGNATMLMTVKDISVRQSAMGRDTTLSYSDMKDIVRIVFSPEGKVLSSEQVDSSDAAAVINQIEPGRLLFLPGREVKTGESWDEGYNETKSAGAGTPFALEMAVENKYTLTGKENSDGKELYRISNSGTIGITGKGSQMGLEMFIEGNAVVKGYSLFDAGRKMIVFTENDTEMELNVAVTGPQEMTIPMTQQIKTIVRVK